MTELNLVSTSLGRFEILNELGRGGMAVVYRARQSDLERIVALKVLPPGLTHDPSYVARFRQEARSAARLEHPHIMPIYEVGEANGLHYIAMKYIQGQTLKEVLQKEGYLPVARAASILAQIGDALDYAHRQGVIHRDIKPSNMMLTDEGWVYLTDFGLARGAGTTSGLTMAGTVMGTPEYMSPEQAQGLATVGPPTDIYALGVVLYELLTGCFPFTADTPMGMLAARLLQTPIPPRDVRSDLPSPVEDVIMRALARKPEARFASAGALVAALRAASGIGTAEPPRPATPFGGMPAVEETIRMPPVTPPYVRPVPPTATPPPVGRLVAEPPVPHPVGSNWGTPPVIPPQAPPTTPRKGLRSLPIILAALGIACMTCIGLVVMLSLRNGDPGAGTSTTNEVEALIAPLDTALGDPEGLSAALAGYRNTLALYPDSPLLIERLALATNASGDWGSAEEYANQLIDNPASSPTQIATGYALLADALASQGDLNSALSEIDQAISNDAELALAHAIDSNLRAVRALAASNRTEMDEALNSLDRAVDALDSEDRLVQALTYNALGFTFSEEFQFSTDNNAFNESQAYYQKALDLIPGAGLFRSNLAYLLMFDGEYDEARGEFTQAAEAGYVPALAGRGWAYYNEDDLDLADSAFDAAIEADPALYEGYLGKGRILFSKEDYQGAIEQFNYAASLSPRNPDIQGWLGESYFWVGYNAAGDEAEQALNEAETAYTNALNYNERHVFSIAGLGWTFQHLERYDESIERFDAAIRLDAGNATLYNGRGWSYFNQGNYSEAEANFRAATARDSNYSYAYSNLGRTLEEQGRTEEARDAYTQALELNPDLQEAQDGLDRLGS